LDGEIALASAIDSHHQQQGKREHGNAVSLPKKARLNCLTTTKKKDTAMLCPYPYLVGTRHCRVPTRTADIPIRILAV